MTTPNILVVGGSLAGLMSAHALANVGLPVTVLERSGAAPRSGAALAVDAAELIRVLGPDRAKAALGRRQRASAMPMTWTQLHRGFVETAAVDPLITLLHETVVAAVDQDGEQACATTVDGRTLRADVLVGADGYRSVVRRAVAPQHPDARFAGYMLWLGIADEQAIFPPWSWPTGLDIRSGGPHHLLGYPLASENAVDGRRLGWAWYDATRNDLLQKTGSVAGTVAMRSLQPEDIPEAVYRDLADEARQYWPSPWREAIIDSIERRSVIGTPISEYIPDQLVRGRLALVGDAAHVPTPMTGRGFASSLADAAALSAALHSEILDIPAALRAYEHDRLAAVRHLVQSGQSFSRSFAR